MILAIDVGNTNIELGVFSEDKLKFTMRIASDRNKTSDEMAISIKAVLSFYGCEIDKIEDSIISSVVPQLTKSLTNAIIALTGKKPMIVGPGLKTGVNIQIDNPAQLGADLLVGCVAANAKYQLPAIIIDMGTATTLSVLEKGCKMVGCVIVPGVRTSINALSGNTAQLPYISVQTPKNAIGKNTIDSMQSGIVFGNAAMLDGMIERLENEVGEKCTYIATGGLAKEICKQTKHEIFYEPDLLLEGLLLIYKNNR